MNDEIDNVYVYPTTDLTLPAFDNTKLVALNTCPTWGVLRYVHHKTMSNGGRAMALEAGAAAHEVFAAHRLYSLKEGSIDFYGWGEDTANEVFTATGRRLFGPERFSEMVDRVTASEDFRTRCQQFSLTALYNSGFYDDPGDKRRTTTNIEEMCIAYMDRFDWMDNLPIVRGNQQEFVGIEIPIDVTIQFTLKSGDVKLYRFIGKADGIHWKDKRKDVIRIHENKTSSRLGEAWEQSFEMSHQVTGYMIGLSTMLNLPISQGLVLGSSLPMPKAYAINGLSRVPVTRYEHQFKEWFEWFWHTTRVYEKYKDDPINAPKYTHSCNRYFRPCSFIPFCAVPNEERQDVMNDMRIDEWSPLHDVGATDE